MNLYWAVQHYDGLAELRGEQGRPEHAASPSFLVTAHRHAMDERARHGAPPENKVRATARKLMQRKRAEAEPPGS